MKIRIWFLPILLMALHCGRVPDTHYYTIYYPITESVNSPARIDGDLIVAKITAEEVYQGDRLVYQRNPFEYEYYHYRRWIEPPPDLMEKWLVRHLKARRYFSRVGTYTNSMHLEKDYELRIHLGDFKEVDDGNQWLAEVRFEYNLLAKNAIVAEGVIAKTVAVPEQTPLAVVQALSQAVKSGFDELAEKIIALNLEN